jgi:FkbM family methyltransferase
MSSRLLKAASHQIGSLRFMRRPIPGQGRFADAIGKLAGWIGGDCSVDFPIPGVQFETDMEDRIQRQMWAVLYEPHVRDCFNAYLKPGDVYIDVGAHIGFHAVFAAHRVGKDGLIFAFEPDLINFQRLQRNLLQFPWARCINTAVWDRTSSLTFERSSTKGESGWGKVSAMRDFGTGERVEIPSIALDDWFRDSQVRRWDAMKLDAEGSELAVLRGAQISLEKFRPVLVMEINVIIHEQRSKSPFSPVEFLLEREYRIFQLKFRRLEEWSREKSTGLCDVLCLPSERADEVLEHLAIKGLVLVR